MAAATPRSAAKRRLEDLQSSDRLSKRRLPVSELYKPTMVTVVVSNASITPKNEKPEKEDFQIPRALISMHSKYFDTVFRKQFAERSTGRSELDDVRPWIFRCFVGWLFFQRIFRDDNRVEPSELGDGDAFLPNKVSNGNGLVEARPHAEAQVKRSQLEMLEDPSVTNEDYVDPTSWPYHHLIELYVFAEKYDSREFRMAVFNIIQWKMISFKHGCPGEQAITYASQNLLPTSGLIKLFVDYYQIMRLGDKYSRGIGKMSRLPASFLAACFLQARRFSSSNLCKNCTKRKKCESQSHTKDDTFDVCNREPCYYHEHGQDEDEKARCAKKWKNLQAASPTPVTAGSSRTRANDRTASGRMQIYSMT